MPEQFASDGGDLARWNPCEPAAGAARVERESLPSYTPTGSPRDHVQPLLGPAYDLASTIS
jgi:hypothetical protein